MPSTLRPTVAKCKNIIGITFGPCNWCIGVENVEGLQQCILHWAGQRKYGQKQALGRDFNAHASCWGNGQSCGMFPFRFSKLLIVHIGSLFKSWTHGFAGVLINAGPILAGGCGA
eukprot:1160970-Pelagomonas_calceolata.AAC.2